MKRSKTYTLKGKPTPLARHRTATTSKGNNVFYDAQKNTKLIHGITLRSQHNDEPLFKGPLKLIVDFHMPIPMHRKRFIKPGDYHWCKPDSSNLLKYIEDTSNCIIFNDDAQICVTEVNKFYDTETYTTFTIQELE